MSENGCRIVAHRRRRRQRRRRHRQRMRQCCFRRPMAPQQHNKHDITKTNPLAGTVVAIVAIVDVVIVAFVGYTRLSYATWLR